MSLVPAGWACRLHTHTQVTIRWARLGGRQPRSQRQLGRPRSRGGSNGHHPFIVTRSPDGWAHWRHGVVSASRSHSAVNRMAVPVGKPRPPWAARLEPVGQTDRQRRRSRLRPWACPSSWPPSALGLAQRHTSGLTASWTLVVTDTDVAWSPGVSQLRMLCLHHPRGARWMRACGSDSGIT